ncbi:unnamed protein product [Chrysoparadoxa australica]
MWMCDKAPVQLILSELLAGLVHNSHKSGMMFMRCFFITMRREWRRLDYLRIDKFYTMVRCFLREGFAYCKATKGKGKKNKKRVFDLEQLREFIAVVEEEILLRKPNGLRLHLADTWISELLRASKAQVSTDELMVALEPWFGLVAEGGGRGGGAEADALFRRVDQEVFRKVLASFQKDADVDGDAEGEENEEEDTFLENVDPTAVQARLFYIAGHPDTREKVRSAVYASHKAYQRHTRATGTEVQALPWFSDWLKSQPKDAADSQASNGMQQKKKKNHAPVAGWVAQGIASGLIPDDDEDEDEEKEDDEMGKDVCGKKGSEPLIEASAAASDGMKKAGKKAKKKTKGADKEENVSLVQAEVAEPKPSKSKRPKSSESAASVEGNGSVEVEVTGRKKRKRRAQSTGGLGAEAEEGVAKAIALVGKKKQRGKSEGGAGAGAGAAGVGLQAPEGDSGDQTVNTKTKKTKKKDKGKAGGTEQVTLQLDAFKTPVKSKIKANARAAQTTGGGKGRRVTFGTSEAKEYHR